VTLALLAGVALFVGCSSEPEAMPHLADAASKRSLPAGEVVGYTGTYGSHVWEGLPFAEAPVGDLRFRSPLPARPWSGTREAVAFGSPCPQFASLFAGIVDEEPGTFAGEEDCLFLNVYAPVMTAEQVPAGGDRLRLRLVPGAELRQEIAMAVLGIPHPTGWARTCRNRTRCGWLRRAVEALWAHLDGDGTSRWGLDLGYLPVLGPYFYDDL